MHWAVRNYALWRKWPRGSCFGTVVFSSMELWSRLWHLIFHNWLSQKEPSGSQETATCADGHKLKYLYTCTAALPLRPRETLLLRLYLTHRSPVTHSLLPMECRLTRFSPGLGSHTAPLSYIAVTQHRLTRVTHGLETTVPGVRSARTVRGSGNMSVRTAVGVWKS